jgi:hypothetical protein
VIGFLQRGAWDSPQFFHSLEVAKTQMKRTGGPHGSRLCVSAVSFLYVPKRRTVIPRPYSVLFTQIADDKTEFLCSVFKAKSEELRAKSQKLRAKS